jgi:hypothetical protein
MYVASRKFTTGYGYSYVFLGLLDLPRLLDNPAG